VKRERMLQVAVGLLGLFYLCLIYPLYTDLWHSRWLLEMKNECEPMFLSWFIALGPFLLLAAKKPSLHRSLIAFAACQSLLHALVMTIQTVEAWKHGVHRDFTDVVLFGIIGGIVLTLLLATRKQSAVVAQ
jgi:FtsH-binding integral membrane protein